MTEEFTWGWFMETLIKLRDGQTPEEENETWGRVAGWLNQVDPDWEKRMVRMELLEAFEKSKKEG